MLYLCASPTKKFIFNSSQQLNEGDFVCLEYSTLHNREKQSIFKVLEGINKKDPFEIRALMATELPDAKIIDIFRRSIVSSDFIRECFDPTIYSVSLGHNTDRTYDFRGYGNFKGKELVVVETEYRYLIGKIIEEKEQTSYDGELKEIICSVKSRRV